MEQYVYWLIILITFFMWFINRKSDTIPFLSYGKKETWHRWFTIVVILIAVLFLLTVISINSHTGLGGAQKRF